MDAAKLPYAQQRAALDSVPAKVNILLARLDRNLEELPATRSQSYNAQLSADDVEDAYGKIINDLLNVRDASAQLASDTTLSDHMRAAAAVARAKDYISQQRDVGLEVVGEGNFSVSLRRKFLLTDAGYKIAEATLRSVGTEAEQQLFDRGRRRPATARGHQPHRPLLNLSGTNTTAHPVQPRAVGYRDGRVQQAVPRAWRTQLDADIVTQATALRDDVQRQVFVETSVLLGTAAAGDPVRLVGRPVDGPVAA